MAGPGRASKKRKRSKPSSNSVSGNLSKKGKASKVENNSKGTIRAFPEDPAANVRRENDLPGILYDPALKERYIIGEILGRGTYGVVVAGWDKKLKIPVAIKVIVRKIAKKIRKNGLYMPLEVYLQRKLDHPNVVKLFGYVADDTHIAMFLERPVGYISLYDHLRQMEVKTGFDTLHEMEAKTIFKHVVRGMLYCLRRQVFHQDLSICNILVHPETLDAKIIDFGCAAIVNPAGHNKITANIEATPPEYWELRQWLKESLKSQLGNGESVVMDRPEPVQAEKAVAWSCGAILYHMLVGGSVYDRNRVPRLSLNGTPQGFQRVASKLLSTEPQSRMLLQQALVDPYLR